jgi:hypothetical protein
VGLLLLLYDAHILAWSTVDYLEAGVEPCQAHPYQQEKEDGRLVDGSLLEAVVVTIAIVIAIVIADYIANSFHAGGEEGQAPQ